MAGNDREGGAAPVQVRGTVLTVRRVDAYVAMTVVAPAIATRFRPGQFIAIAVGGPQSGMLARRTFSVHDVRPDHGGTVEFVFLPREPGAQWLADCRSRDVLDVVGPLGRPFPVPRDPASCLLLGVGPGARAAVRAGLPAGRARLGDRLPARRGKRRPGVRRAHRPADRALGGHHHRRRLPRLARLGGGHAADRRAAGAHRRDLRVRADGGAALGVRAGGPVRHPGPGPGVRARR